MIYVGTRHAVYAIDTNAATVKWRFEGTGPVNPPTVSPDGRVVYVACLWGTDKHTGQISGHVFAVDSSTGQQLWEYTAGAEIQGSAPAVSPSGSSLIFGANDAKLYSLDTAHGKLQWQITLDGFVESSPVFDRSGKTIYVGSGLGGQNMYAITP